MTYQIRLAHASQPECVRHFAEAVDVILDQADPELVTRGRGHTHSMSYCRIQADTGTASFDVPRTRRSRVTWVTTVIRIGVAGTIQCECECPSSEDVCEHIAASLIKLVEHVAEDDERLMRLQGMTQTQIEDVRESRRPGRTRWAANAYPGGQDLAAAFTRSPGPLPEPSEAPDTPGVPDYSSGAYSLHAMAGEISLRTLEDQAARAAQEALDELTEDEGTTHVRP